MPDTLTLWTIQALEAWETLQQLGRLSGRRRFAEPEFRAAYSWLMTQLQEKVGPPPHPDDFPIWAWFQWDGTARPRPDLRARGHLPSGAQGVRIKFQIAADEVLLSDFELWHDVLNGLYLAGSISEMEKFDVALSAQGLSTTQDLWTHPVYGPEIRASWQRIFDLDWVQEEMTAPLHEKSIQAVFWELRLDMVQQVDPFTAR